MPENDALPILHRPEFFIFTGLIIGGLLPMYLAQRRLPTLKLGEKKEES